MALTEVNGVDVDAGRAEMARGLCELASFLLDHPDVPEPHVYISAVGSTKALVAWCDGMDVDDLQVEMGAIDSFRQLVRTFAALPEAASLAAANKRVGNILKKVEDSVDAWVDTALLKETAEVALHAALVDVVPQADAAFVTGDYTESLQALAALRAPVDAFFDDVMVNAEDPALRANRLGLLAKLHAAMNQVADLSKLSA